VVLALISSAGLTRPLLTLALFLVLELANLYVIEPRVCGPSIGVALVPLLLAILFWTGLWGVVGLVLATPLTVCLAVLGKHVPQLEFLAVLLASRPALSAEARYYQRLLARDRYEAGAIIKDYLSAHSVEKLYGEVLVPALVRVRRGRQKGELRPEDEQFILQTTRELMEDLGRGHGRTAPSAGTGRGPAPAGANGPHRAVTMIGVPACDQVDEVALLMIRHLVGAGGPELRDVRLAEGEALPLGMGSLLQQERPALVFIAALAPGGLTQARYLCRRLRSQFPRLRIVVGRWVRRRNARKTRKLLLSAGADRVATTLREAHREVLQLARTLANLRDAT
jgi:hypothetical protein